MKDLLDLWLDEKGTGVILSSYSFAIFEVGKIKSTEISVKHIHSSSPCVAMTGQAVGKIKATTSNSVRSLPSVFVASADTISSWGISQCSRNSLKYEVKSILRLGKQQDQESVKNEIINKSKLNLSTSSTLTFSIANEVSIMAVSQQNKGLALCKS